MSWSLIPHLGIWVGLSDLINQQNVTKATFWDFQDWVIGSLAIFAWVAWGACSGEGQFCALRNS